MTRTSKAPPATEACHCEERCLDCGCQINTKPLKRPLPSLNPLIAIALERFRSEVMAADFYSREYNQALPELIDEVLRIVRESRP